MMETICSEENCTGCGMCTNICPREAIAMVEGECGFVYPEIDTSKCVECGICQKICPGNQNISEGTTIRSVYAAWSRDQRERKKSTSGGVFSELARYVLQNHGAVVGVQWSENFLPEHVIIEDECYLDKLKSSKYAQSDTGKIYYKVRRLLQNGKLVLFSGTPCQNAALRAFLRTDYENLICIDFVCHGVPSAQMLLQHYRDIHEGEIKNVCLRYKDPYWDYSHVRIDFSDGYSYQKLTGEDDYFNLFNIGYTLRMSCHNCKYANTHRTSDITLADFWGYLPHNMKELSYNKGTSCVLINSKKGQEYISFVRQKLYLKSSSLSEAVRGNKCLTEPFYIEEKVLHEFWSDYLSGKSLHNLNQKYATGCIPKPSFLWLRRMYRKYRWIIKR